MRRVLGAALALSCLACAPAAVHASSNQPPVPILKVAASAHAGDSVHVDGNDSSDVDGSVVDGFILFGDGSDPVVGFVTDHVYATPGLYLVELYIDDDKGARSRARARITIE